MDLGYIIIPPNILIPGISVMHLDIKYTYFNPNSTSCRVYCVCKVTAGSALMQQSDTENRDQGLVGQANTTKCREPECFMVLRLTGMCPRKHQKTLVFPFDVHTILENPVLHINFFFRFAFTLLFIPMSGMLFTNLCIQDTHP